jgi:putative transposase
MRQLRFTDSKIMATFKQAEAGLSVPEPCRKHGISRSSLKILANICGPQQI